MKDIVPIRSKSQRMLELDLLRLVAALMVVVAHYMTPVTAKHRFNLELGSVFDWGEPLGTIANFGVLGVDIFFMISGYVIALSAEGRSVRSFLASRAARILPAFWFCCVITWVLVWMEPNYRQISAAQLLANLSFVARPLGYEFIDSSYWSLVVEVRFYLMIAVLLWWRGIRDLPAFLAVWLSMSALHIAGVLPSVVRFIFLPQYAPYFAAGSALFLIGERRQLAPAYALLTAALGLACLQAPQRLPALFAGQTLVVCAVIVMAALALWLVATKRSAWLGRPWMAVAGSLTYPLYLLHQELGYLLIRHFPMTNVGWIDHRVTITSTVLALIFMGSYMVMLFVELPTAPLIRSWLSGPKKPASDQVRSEVNV